MDYNSALEQLGKRDSKKLAHNTYLQRREDGKVAIKYHATDVVTLEPDGTVELNTGGWFSVTTKARMCTYSGYSVSSQGGTWSVSAKNPSYVFRPYGDPMPSEPYWLFVGRYFDGIRLRGGLVLNPAEGHDADLAYDRDKQTKRDIARYLKGMTQEVWSSVVNEARERGTSGDCLYCQLNSQNPEVGDVEHLRSHLDEGYYMVTLTYNAVAEMGYRDPGLIIMMSERDTHNIKRALRRYLSARLLEGPSSGRRPTAARADHWGG